MAYKSEYNEWRDNPEAFWERAAGELVWSQPWRQAFDAGLGVYGRWFPDAECNVSYNCLDRHIDEGHGARTALIYDSPVTGTARQLTYSELQAEVATLAGVLVDLGVKPGDRVVIYMPMVPETVIGMLACARIGAVHSVVFGGFAAKELSARIDDCKPVAILSASAGIEGSRIVPYKPLLDDAIDRSEHKPAACLILQRDVCRAEMKPERDLDWVATMGDARDRNRVADPVAVKATDPLYILYTSGTTGKPKGVVRDCGGHMVALKWSMWNHYGIRPGEVFWAASDVGWVVGHSYIVYAPLLHGCTTVLYEGKPVGTPDAGAYWRVISQHRVTALFTAPTAIRAIRREDPQGAKLEGHDLSSLRFLFLAGERADPETIRWTESLLNIPVLDHWWQTETGSPICGNPAGLELLPVKAGSCTVPMPGYEIEVLNETGRPLGPDESGTLAIRLPLPPGCLVTLWNADDRFRDLYLSDFPGYYTTLDAGYRDQDGYVHVMARTDDVINVAGHRLSTGQLEEAISKHPQIAEVAVIGVKDNLKGQVPIGLAVLSAGAERPEQEVEQEVVRLVREYVGPVAAFKTLLVVRQLPKTRSGKILRGTLRKIADGDPWTMPVTIEDPTVLEALAQRLQERGFITVAV